MRTRSLVAALFLPTALALAAACGGGAPTPPATPDVPAAPTAPSADVPAAPTVSTPPAPTASTPPAPTASTPPAPTADAKIDWKGMSKEQRTDYMKKTVMPKMSELLKGYDGKHWQNVTCATCHGEGAKAGKFDMPNAKLPKLSFTDGFKKHMTKDAKMTKFMMEQVTPTMKDLLGMQAYDPATHQGFGCGGCHVVGP
jgi:hypothetical protein